MLVLLFLLKNLYSFMKINYHFGGAFPDFPKQYLALSLIAHYGMIVTFSCLSILLASSLPHFVPPFTAIGWHHDSSKCPILYIPKA